MPSAAEVVGRRLTPTTDRPVAGAAAVSPVQVATASSKPLSAPPGSRPPGVPSRPSPSVSPADAAVATTLAASGSQAASAFASGPGDRTIRRPTLDEDPGGLSTLPETSLDELRGRASGVGGVVRTPPPAKNHQMPPTIKQFAGDSEAGLMAASWGRLVSVRQDGTDGKSYPLVDESVTIGRAGVLAFPDDRFLAREHALFERGTGACAVVPLDRINGVFRRLSAPTPLADGDMLLLGRELLRFELVEASERSVEALVQHGVARFGSPVRAPWGRIMEILANGGVRDVRHAAVPELVIGREEGHITYPMDEFLSRRHATLKWQDARCVVEDLGSSNGTYIRVRSRAELQRREFLRMGNQLFRFEAGMP